MNDGLYRLRFNAAGADADGSITVTNEAAVGADPYRHLSGTFIRTGTNVEATLDVTCVDGAPLPIGGAKQYTIKLAGNSSHHHFSVIGVGPLGLIVELTGEWQDTAGHGAWP